MKKINYIVSFLILIFVVTGCGNNKEETTTSSTAVKDVKNSDKESKYATEDDVLSTEEETIDGIEYIFYTFKNGIKYGLPKETTLEEAKLDLDELVIPEDYTETRE